MNKSIRFLFLSFFLISSIIGIEKSSLSETLAEHLGYELDDARIARELAAIIVENALTWKAPTIALEEIDSIIAFAFGNRILPNGNRLPGPMNEALADIVVQLHKDTNAPVYAQWEIAEVIGNRIASEKVIVINPTFDALANVVYLSTAGVVSAAVKMSGGDPQKLGKVAVVAFNDHIFRCIKLSRGLGIDAYAPADYSMPSTYDSESGQPWTRDRLAYLITDIKTRLA